MLFLLFPRKFNNLYTTCPRSLDPYYLVHYNRERTNHSWTYSMYLYPTKFLSHTLNNVDAVENIFIRYQEGVLHILKTLLLTGHFLDIPKIIYYGSSTYFSRMESQDCVDGSFLVVPKIIL